MTTLNTRKLARCALWISPVIIVPVAFFAAVNRVTRGSRQAGHHYWIYAGSSSATDWHRRHFVLVDSATGQVIGVMDGY